MFPDFNIYSGPLLILVAQGILLSLLLFNKAFKLKNRSYLLLAILLLITCYHRTTYTIGFMGWYDTYRNTKINYFLISLSLAVGPLIYFYMHSCIYKKSRFEKKQWLHFIPVFLYVFFFVFVYLYDSRQAGFADTANGVFRMKLGELFWTLLETGLAMHLAVYLFFSFRLYFKYRAALVHHYSNTFKYELHWFRNFLYLFSFLFLYNILQSITDGFIFDLHWTEEWWFQFFSILVVIYLGVKGYFTATETLPDIELEIPGVGSDIYAEKLSTNQNAENYDTELEKLRQLIVTDELYLNANLSLRSLSQKSGFAPSQLSKIINIAAGQNFNDFVNQYRVEHVKDALKKTSNSNLSILAIALDSGFNSKATFNRVFKKFTGQSPSVFRK